MITQTLRYKYRLDPSEAQAEQLAQFGAWNRGVWNLLLCETTQQYEKDKTFLFYKQFADKLKELKPQSGFEWLKSFDSAAAQQVARDLDQAIREGTDKVNQKAFPKHKVTYRKKKLNNDSFRCVNTNNSVRIEDGRLRLPKIGFVPIRQHRALPNLIKSCTVIYQAGKWYASFTQEVACRSAKELLKGIVGYDINSEHTVVGSNGYYVPNPKFLKKSKDKLKQLQRQLSRRKKGSNRWNKSKLRLQKQHKKIGNQRLAFAHEVSCTIAKSSDIVVFEDLNVKAMQKWNGHMIKDNVMGLITNLTEYKVARLGGVFEQIGRYERSTGVCHVCGTEHRLSLKQRHFKCLNCEEVQMRDEAAAITIERKGETKLSAAGIVVHQDGLTPVAQTKFCGKTRVFTRSGVKLQLEPEQKKAA
ncbi:transposase [Photobacterium sp. ZSDE20]|uniref:Transposase n=1 Tax=Photobacterium pectinilyticum TaxID=2906793 RepID=A0ABT1MXC6_9GAMM|nr:transposase [Photobacterium sp. ZSDE20]MCQ1057019.1 transposase [Photobacterium sp. ZSDE20]MDD1821154.1 transposase [Photobacterium sp. ZSDE20]